VLNNPTNLTWMEIVERLLKYVRLLSTEVSLLNSKESQLVRCSFQANGSILWINFNHDPYDCIDRYTLEICPEFQLCL